MWCFFLYKQKTAYEMRISDWSSDVCSSDLTPSLRFARLSPWNPIPENGSKICAKGAFSLLALFLLPEKDVLPSVRIDPGINAIIQAAKLYAVIGQARFAQRPRSGCQAGGGELLIIETVRSEEHTSELQSLMRTSYAVFCLKTKKH